MKKKLPRSLRKYIRREKARIRREVLGAEEQKKLIVGLYEKFQKKEKLTKSPSVIQTDKQASKKTEKKKAPKKKTEKLQKKKNKNKNKNK